MNGFKQGLITLPREEKLMQELVGKAVEVQTVETLYRGVLVEIGESEVSLQAETGWVIIPLDRVVNIQAAE